ncbi:Z1 domain-containing protein [Arthrobacter rhombi]|uniref:Z1 domain-containing protein n=1 Tax=Arthrobacter rhombi TaxID=71253 RepID=UPI003FD60666
MEKEVMQARISEDKSGTAPISVGPALSAFLEGVVPESGRKRMRQDSIDILSRCSIYEGGGGTTGLVVGQVQSGKTLSYESVICAAHDNNVPLVVVISGISNPLLEQGIGRLRSDLGSAAPNSWSFLDVRSSSSEASVELLRKVADDWTDPDLPHSRRKTAVAFVLKHHGRLDAFTAALEQVDWQGMPTLVIDDEADQASPNTLVGRGRQSTTYQRIMALRASLDNVNYLQYTATPQAPLLISLADALSPEFVHVLDPGEGYVGGEAFFGNDSGLVTNIPALDIQLAEAGGVEPPGSLMLALGEFFIGLAAELKDSEYRGTRSMLVHPSQDTGPHEQYVRWLRRLSADWLSVLKAGPSSPEYSDLLEELTPAYEEIKRTVPKLDPLEDLVPQLRLALRRSTVVEMNTRGGPTPTVQWDDFDGVILVGGQALDRGFTVVGLTVTYMPRGMGVGNADTIQQRARFFGYKQNYLKYCRVHLEAGLRDAFEVYVDHEADIRTRLKGVQSSGAPLKSWRRAFLLDKSLRPTRRTVQSGEFMQETFSNDWWTPRFPLVSTDKMQEFRGAAVDLLEGLEPTELPVHELGTETHRHWRFSEINLQTAVEFLMTVPVVNDGDSRRLSGLIIQLSDCLEDHGGDYVNMYRMRPETTTTRSLDDATGAIGQLFQGESNPTRGFAKGVVYAGDRAYKSPNRLTIQLHEVDLETSHGSTPAVPIVAVWVPDRYTRGWFVK